MNHTHTHDECMGFLANRLALDDANARIAELEAALRAIIKITDGSQPKDYPGALMVARSALAKS